MNARNRVAVSAHVKRPRRLDARRGEALAERRVVEEAPDARRERARSPAEARGAR